MLCNSPLELWAPSLRPKACWTALLTVLWRERWSTWSFLADPSSPISRPARLNDSVPLTVSILCGCAPVRSKLVSYCGRPSSDGVTACSRTSVRRRPRTTWLFVSSCVLPTEINQCHNNHNIQIEMDRLLFKFFFSQMPYLWICSTSCLARNVAGCSSDPKRTRLQVDVEVRKLFRLPNAMKAVRFSCGSLQRPWKPRTW